MSDLIGSFAELFENGSLVVERGGVLSIRSGNNAGNALEWLKTQASGRIDKNSNSFVFFGAANTTMVELVESDGDVRYTHFALRAADEQVFDELQTRLGSGDSGFEHVQAPMPKNCPIWFCGKLGFAIRIVWRPVIPQDPGVTEGVRGVRQLDFEFDPNRKPDEADDQHATKD
jgi:hypothetical protein